MSKYVSIHFKFQGRMCSVILKTSVEDITLSMIEDRIYKKLSLDESKVKLELSYIPLLVGCKEQITISDDEDLFVYLTSIDKENRKCLLFVEARSRSEHDEQLSRAGKSSFGMNYEELEPNVDVGPNAINLYVGGDELAKQNEVLEAENVEHVVEADTTVETDVNMAD